MKTQRKSKRQNEKHKGVLLLIEDEEDTADLLVCRLEQAGYTVVHAKDGRKATDLIEDMAPPRAVLLDLVVPYVNGFELLKILRTKIGWESVPIMVVSGDSFSGDIERMLKEGANDYIVKSWGFMTICSRLEQLLLKAA